MASSSEMKIRKRLVDWMAAVSAGDRPAILAHHSEDLLMFDFPGTVEGLDAYDRTCEFFLKTLADRSLSCLVPSW